MLPSGCYYNFAFSNVTVHTCNNSAVRVPGIVMTELQVLNNLTTGAIVVIGDEFTVPVSPLGEKLPLIFRFQSAPPPTTNVIQAVLAKLLHACRICYI